MFKKLSHKSTGWHLTSLISLWSRLTSNINVLFSPDPSCQLVTQTAWRRGFVKLSSLMCLLGLFIPVLVWTPLVRFQPGLGDDGGNLSLFQKLIVFYRGVMINTYGGTLELVSALKSYI
jgi:hypothetical protein